jgi:hypothetical protein
MRFFLSIIPWAAVLLVAGCRTPTVNNDPTLCPQTGEFANHGCARFAAILTTPSGAPAPGVMLRGMLFDTASAGMPNGLNSDRSDAAGRVGLQLTWYARPPKSDTIRLRLVAIRIPSSSAESPQTLDSLDVALLFTRVGQRPALDTMRWQLRQ